MIRFMISKFGHTGFIIPFLYIALKLTSYYSLSVPL